MNTYKDLRDHLKCKLCNNTYEDPIILPCYKTICSNHIFSETMGEVFKCTLCHDDHAITATGFPKNEDIFNLVNVSQNYIHLDSALSDKNQKAKDLCKQFEQIVHKLELLANDPLCYIYEYFGRIKSDLDLCREKQVKMIDDHYNKVLKDIEKAEKDRKSNAATHDFSDELKKAIEIAKENLDESLLETNKTTLLDDSNWIDFEYSYDKNILISEYHLKKFESKLLNYNKYEFKENKSTKESNFGELYQSDYTLPNEDRLHGRIKFKVENLKSFKHGDFKVLPNLTIINKLPWIVSVSTYAKDYDFFLALHIEPVFYFSRSNELSVSMDAGLDLKVLKENGSISRRISFHSIEYNFDPEDTSHSYNINMTKLKYEDHDAYSLIKDSANFQLDINIINQD